MKILKRYKVAVMACAAMMVMSVTGGLNASAASNTYPPIKKVTINFTDITGKAIEGKDGTTKLKVTDSKGHQAKVKKLKDFSYVITSNKDCVLKPGETYTISQSETGDYVSMKLSVKLPDNLEYGGEPNAYCNMEFNIRKFRWGDLNFDGKVNFNDITAMKRAIDGSGRYKCHVWKNKSGEYETCEWVGKQLFASQDFYECVWIDKIIDDEEIMIECRSGETSGNTGFSHSSRYSDPLWEYVIGSGMHVNNKPVVCVKKNPADVDGNNKLSVNDLTRLQKYVAGWKVQLGQ